MTARMGEIAVNGQEPRDLIYAGGLLVILLIGHIGTCVARVRSFSVSDWLARPGKAERRCHCK